MHVLYQCKHTSQQYEISGLSVSAPLDVVEVREDIWPIQKPLVFFYFYSGTDQQESC